MGAGLCCFNDTGWLKHTCHVSPADSFLGNNLQLSHMTAPEKKRKHLVIYSFFFLFLAVSEELGTNSPVADSKDVCPKEILFLTTKITCILWSTFLERKPAFLCLLIFRVSFLIPCMVERSREGVVKKKKKKS